MDRVDESTEGVVTACRRVLRAEVRALSVGIGLVLAVMLPLFRLWDLRPRVPILYHGDAVLTMGAFKNMLLNGWYSSSELLGVPYGQDLRDFPAGADLLHLMASWCLVMVTRDPALAFNVFFLASFLTVFLGAFTGCRMLAVGPWSSMVVGVLYTFLPYHVLHGPGHLFLSSYGAVPLWVALAVRQMGDRPLVAALPNLRCPRDWMPWIRQPSHLAATAIVLLGSTTGSYYATFMVFTLVVTGGIAGIARFDLRRIVVALGLSVVAAVALLAQFVPTWMLHRQIGSNSEIVDRGLRNIEYYSLKLSDLVLPVAGHRVDALADLRDESLELVLRGEGAEAIGLVGLVGLGILAIVAAVRLVRGRTGGRHGTLALIAGAAFAMGTVGGGATVVGVFGFTFLRAWDRISVVIAFCALAAVGIGLDRLRSRVGSRGAVVLVGVVLMLGVLDTNPGFPFVDFDHTAGAWASDRLVVEQAEELFGAGAQVFQLPVIPFPEHHPPHGMIDYDHLRAYLHSDTLGWSYGGIKGRASDWQHRLTGLPPDEMATALAGAGFDAIWVDRLGFGPELSETEAALGQPDLVSPDGRIAIHDLRPLADELLVVPGSAEVARAAAALLEPVTVALGDGFHGPEFDADRAFSWAPERAEVRLRNPMGATRTVHLRFVVASAVEGSWALVVHSPRGAITHEMPSSGSVIDLVVETPPGETVLRLQTDAPRLETTDPRDIRFRVFEPTVVPAS